MEDIVFVTADSIRRDRAEHLPFVSSLGVKTGVTVSHYTRASLAGLLSGQYRSAVETRVVPPTIADVLSSEGYTCLGFSPNPNTDERFGFDAGFSDYRTFVEPGNQGSTLRQYLSKFQLLRWVYYRLYPPQAKSENRPSDREVVELAVDRFNAASSPRFLWVHLMESHRPYGAGDEAVPQHLDRKAFFSPGKLSEDEKATIDRKYEDALGRIDANVEFLLDNIDSDPIFAFTADHGEGFGDAGFYFHQAHRRRVDDFLIEVPTAFDGVDVGADRFGHADLAPTLVDAVGLTPPDAWNGTSLLDGRTPSAITVAPWHGKATVAWRDLEHDYKLIARDADVSFEGAGSRADVERADVPDELEDQLRNLGYLDAG